MWIYVDGMWRYLKTTTIMLVARISAEVLAEAVVRAVKAARAAGGLPAHRDLTSNWSIAAG